MDTKFAFQVNGRRFESAAVEEDPVAFHRALELAWVGKQRPLCMCREPGVPMVVVKRARFFLRRFAGSATQHQPGCNSHIVAEKVAHATQEDLVQGLRFRAQVDLRKLIGRSAASSKRTGRSHDTRPHDSLLTIGRMLWKRAGMLSWHAHYRASPWQVAAARLDKASRRLLVNGHELADRLLLIGAASPNHHATAMEQQARTSVRDVYLAVGSVAHVAGTTRDAYIDCYGGVRLWVECHNCIGDYNAARSMANAADRGYVVGVFAVYWDRNIRCLDYCFMPVTHEWLPLRNAGEAKLLAELVGGGREFMLPVEPGAIHTVTLYDTRTTVNVGPEDHVPPRHLQEDIHSPLPSEKDLREQRVRPNALTNAVPRYA